MHPSYADAMLSKSRPLPYNCAPRLSSPRCHRVVSCQGDQLNAGHHTPKVITARGGTSAELKHLIALHSPSRPVLLVAAPPASFENLTNNALTTAVTRTLMEMRNRSTANGNADTITDAMVPLVVKIPVCRSDRGIGGERSGMADVLHVLGPLPDVKQDCCITVVYGEEYIKELCHSQAWPYVAASIRHCMRSIHGMNTQSFPMNTVSMYKRNIVSRKAQAE